MNYCKLLRRSFSAVFLAILAGVICTGCQTSDLQYADAAGAAASAGSGKADAAPESTRKADVAVPTGKAEAVPLQSNSIDFINVGDSLSFSFTDVNPAITPFERNVSENGTLTLMENQTFTAAGKTREQLEKEIHERYVPNFYTKMTVTIAPKERFFYVKGEVRSSGRVVFSGTMTVTKAITTAGDFTDFAKKTKVKLLRLNGEKLTIDCKKAITDPRLDLPVYPGDIIYVPRRLLF